MNYHKKYIIDNVLFITELYKKYNKQFTEPSLPFNGSSCNIDLQIEDFINLMTVRYTKGPQSVESDKYLVFNQHQQSSQSAHAHKLLDCSHIHQPATGQHSKTEDSSR